MEDCVVEKQRNEWFMIRKRPGEQKKSTVGWLESHDILPENKQYIHQSQVPSISFNGLFSTRLIFPWSYSWTSSVVSEASQSYSLALELFHRFVEGQLLWGCPKRGWRIPGIWWGWRRVQCTGIVIFRKGKEARNPKLLNPGTSDETPREQLRSLKAGKPWRASKSLDACRPGSLEAPRSLEAIVLCNRK